MIPFPPTPALPEEQKTQATLLLRYEDISQEGRVKLLALPHALGASVWRNLFAPSPAYKAAVRSGVLPILSRFVLEGGEDSVSIHRPLEIEACYQLAHTRDEKGEVNRLILNFWATLTGRVGHTNFSPIEREGEATRVGRVFAEHVFTRPFASAEERKVTRFEFEGVEPVPPARHVWQPPEAVLSLPEGVKMLDEALVADEAPVVFGLCHTDSNQHVNSLVYPRLFEEAALKRFAAHGRSTAVLARQLEISYRKPCFAGEKARIWLKTFESGEGLGVVGAFLPEGESPAADPGARIRAYCYLRMWFLS